MKGACKCQIYEEVSVVGWLIGCRDANPVSQESDHATPGSDNLETDILETDILETDFGAYHSSHARGHLILARIQIMLACRARGQYMFHVRMAIKHSRMAELHERCANILDAPEPDLENLFLFEKYIPISGALTSDEYVKLLEGSEPVPIPFVPLRSDGMCLSCRNLDSRSTSHQNDSSILLTSIMGGLSIDEEHPDDKLVNSLGLGTTIHAVKHHKLGSLTRIATRSECSFCRLVIDCFMRLSEKEISDYGFQKSISDFRFDGVIWFSVVPDPVGDHLKELSARDHHDPRLQLDKPDSPVPSGRTRMILSLLPEGEEPMDVDFEPPVATLHTEILPYAEDDRDASFHVLPWSSSYIDTARAAKWLYTCETYHGDACSAPPNYEHMEVHEDMLLVDVEDGCLVPGNRSHRYFALSYVWGTSQATSFLMTKATLEDSMIPGGLPRDKKEIAKTIRDAMQFTHDMKVRYLWVDALCIAQDDEASKYLQLMHMDAIYRQAVLTIVAGDNSDAADGICGLGSRPRESFQRTYEFRPGLILTAKEATFGDLEVDIMQAKVSNTSEIWSSF
jgi:hypothetical protein